jgi:hypothetical protein
MSSLANFFVTVKNAISPSILVDSLKTGLFIGLLLNLINYGGDLFDGMVTSWGGVLLNFIIPFCVSAYSGARATNPPCERPVRNPAQSATDHKSTVS